MSINVSQRLKRLLDAERTVFTTRDLQSLWQENERTVIVSAKRMVAQGLLMKLAKGYYAVSKEYSAYELANLIVSPSYVSFDSALFFWNVCFQQADTISSVALLNYEKRVDGRVYKYYAMKESLLFDTRGIVSQKNTAMASAERAILDSYYFGVLPSLDNPEAVNRYVLQELALLYPKTVQKQIKKFYDDNEIRPRSS